MKALLLIVLLAVVPGGAQAQGVDVVGWVSWLELEEQAIEDPDFDVELEWESDMGFGASANWFWGDHLSTELSAFALEAEAQLNFAFPGEDEEVTLELGSVDLTPIMLTAQWHFNTDGVIDPYIGIGAAYVLIGDLDTIIDGEPFTTEFDDELAIFGNVGVGFSFTPNLGLLIDARYIPLEPTITELDEFGEEASEDEIELNPLMISAGLRWRFGGR